MNIAMLTTWNSACGIAEYSRNLVDEFLATKEVNNIILFTNQPETSLEARPRLEVVPIFGVHWWGEEPKIDIKKFAKAWYFFVKDHGDIDVLFIQYQSSLYESEGFNWLLQNVKCPIVITYHDSTVNSKHIFPEKVSSIVHNEDIQAEHYIPFPTIETIPLVFSFGMGRNDYNFIEQVCIKLGVSFVGHDSRKSGWLNENQLFMAMKQADAIVLWYNDVPLKGQSAALRTAISSHRPVIVNDIGWFANAPRFVHKCGFDNNPKLDSIYLQVLLEAVLHLDYIRENSFEKCAERYLEIANGN
jgi:hypothetical protein